MQRAAYSRSRSRSRSRSPFAFALSPPVLLVPATPLSLFDCRGSVSRGFSPSLPPHPHCTPHRGGNTGAGTRCPTRWCASAWTTLATAPSAPATAQRCRPRRAASAPTAPPASTQRRARLRSTRRASSARLATAGAWARTALCAWPRCRPRGSPRARPRLRPRPRRPFRRARRRQASRPPARRTRLRGFPRPSSKTRPTPSTCPALAPCARALYALLHGVAAGDDIVPAALLQVRTRRRNGCKHAAQIRERSDHEQRRRR
jgi:hypothetical protein